MISSDIVNTRLKNQKLITPRFNTSAQVVDWFGAIQAQDFVAAKWVLSLWQKNKTYTEIEEEFNKGLILRTHFMRPTWHSLDGKYFRTTSSKINLRNWI